jgi:hypothetical protein
MLIGKRDQLRGAPIAAHNTLCLTQFPDALCDQVAIGGRQPAWRCRERDANVIEPSMQSSSPDVKRFSESPHRNPSFLDLTSHTPQLVKGLLLITLPESQPSKCKGNALEGRVVDESPPSSHLDERFQMAVYISVSKSLIVM